MRDERVDSTDRTEVIGLLSRALDEGRLPMDDYDHRVARVGTATYASELLNQLQDLPPEYAWLPRTVVATAAAERRPAASGRAALVFGILSLPTSFCVVGGVLGIIAVVLSLRGERERGLSPALVGRVFGIVGIVLAVGALIALVVALNSSAAP
jgi:hypothetical protein